MRLKGPPVETFKIEVEIDAFDLFEKADADAAEPGIHRKLAVLEAILTPKHNDIHASNALVQAGTLEVIFRI